MSSKIYTFGLGKADGDVSMRAVLGGKGCNLADMSKNGLPVPPGFTIPTSECLEYQDSRSISASLIKEIESGVKFIENAIGKGFGDSANPLLVSVRSGAPVSMPGMMDTVLNLGLNDETVEGLAKRSNNKRFAYDSYRRFIQMYSDVVLNVKHSYFEEILDEKKLVLGVKNDMELSEEDFIHLVEEFKKVVKNSTGKDFPSNTKDQLFGAIEAVFKSWNNERAVYYRKINDIPHSLGTAVNIQSMVFGNLGDTSATGVAFTRNPSNGQKYLYGEFLLNAQGEDVVAGIRTPSPINEQSRESGSDGKTLEATMPSVYNEFVSVCQKLESHYKDMQDIEFTIESGKLYILQTRNGKRTARAAVKVAFDMVSEGVISKQEALLRISPDSLNSLLHRSINPNSPKTVLGRGLPASPGASFGAVAFSPEKVKEFSSSGIESILVRIETSPEDIEGMNIASGILTARGGMTSHAAVVARGMGKTCVTGVNDFSINYQSATLTTKNGTVVREGDRITIDGSSGFVYFGSVDTVEPEFFEEFEGILKWADEFRTIKVRVNAETELDSKVGVKFGAEGIGLCRTEHMFFEKGRIFEVRKMIISDTLESRKSALANLLPFQRDDFIKIFNTTDGLPVNIRLLDPPLHEFLPQRASEIEELSKDLGISTSKIEARLKDLHEQNPMLGHRGCRLGITYPEIYEMQARAIFEAAYFVLQNSKNPIVEIMIPFVIIKDELEVLKKMIDSVALDLESKHGKKLSYSVGTMIETPRASLTADKIAEFAEYFSFGTNDLTQTCLALSRDDSSVFIKDYISSGIMEKDPFETLDVEGVGELIKIAIKKGREVRKNIKLGICGEHGGDPKSIDFCVRLGFDYVSCSPYRIPIARVAAAQSALKLSKK